ncbi:MAG: hypothetical protein KAI72_05365 [Candidatus Pacebacteria bacterium]|nr:hypothetical protein [Candidatus Paceibacterota bacterium]
MTNSKNLVIILATALILLAGWTYYTLTVTVPAKAEAGCKATIENEVIPQLTAAAEQECLGAIAQYEQMLSKLQQIPACAAALLVE